MILNLEVSDQVAQKIKALSSMTGMNGVQITEMLAERLDLIISNKIVEAMQTRLNSLGIDRDIMGFPVVGRTPTTKCENPDAGLTEKVMEETPEEVHEETSQQQQENEVAELSIVGSLGAEDEKIEDFDVKLETAEMKDFILPEEDDVPTKDKDGEESNYEDHIMADAQATVDEGGEDVYNEDSIIGAASESQKYSSESESFDHASDVSPGPNSVDVLPVDFDLEKISENNSDAMSFFNKVTEGVCGDKTKRYSIKNKPIRNH